MIVAGMALVFGGLWLNWDLIMSVFFQVPLTHPDWQFCLPVYVVCYGPARWSAPFDIAMGFIISGAFFILIGSFVAFITYESMPCSQTFPATSRTPRSNCEVKISCCSCYTGT
jgi:hypothetical protein